MNDVDHHARVIWDYMLVGDDLEPADVITVLCSYQPLVAEWAAEIFRRQLAPLIVFSGHEGLLTQGRYAGSEAARFAEVAISHGVPRSAILLEESSNNTGQNIQCSAKLLKDKNISVARAILVQKPYMERRTLATALAQWPDPQPQFIITSPVISYQKYMQMSPDKDDSINRMVGDLQRIIEYPAKGWMKRQEVPAEVLAAYNWLVSAGYDKLLIKAP